MELAIDTNIWGYVFYAIVLAFCSMNLFHVFLGERKTSFVLWVSSFVIHAILVGFIFLFINITWVTSLSAMTGRFLISFNYKASMPKRIASVLGEFLTLFSLEAGIVALFGHNLYLTVGTYSASVATFLVLGISIYLITLFLRRFKNIVTLDDLPKSTYVVHLFIPFVSSVLLFLATYLPPGVIPYFVIILFLMNFIFFYIQDRAALAENEKKRGNLVNQEKEFYFAQNELMVDTVETVKGMRHDMKLHLATLKDYTVENPADAVAYIEYLMADLGESEVYSDTGNVALDSIINYKLKDARVDGVQVDLKIFAPAVIGIDTPDVVVIVGNLLANAMDAVEKVADKFINVQIVYQKENLLIKVENSFDGVVKGDFETRKSGDGHGYGLKSVRKSVEKYDGKMDIETASGVFLVKVLLYGKEGS